MSLRKFSNHRAVYDQTLNVSTLTEWNRNQSLTRDAHFLSGPSYLAYKGKVSGIYSLHLFIYLKRDTIKDLFT